jgi:hypothetical protein
MIDLRWHVKQHPDFEKVGDAMLREWNDGLSLTCKPDPEKMVSLPAVKKWRGAEEPT